MLRPGFTSCCSPHPSLPFISIHLAPLHFHVPPPPLVQVNDKWNMTGAGDRVLITQTSQFQAYVR